LAKCERHTGKYGEAINHYLCALESLEKNNGVDNVYISQTLYGLSSCYLSIGRHQEAIKYGESSLKLRSKEDSQIRYASQLLELSKAYLGIGNIDMALKYVDESISIYKSEGEKLDYAIALRSKASIYYELGKDSLGDKFSEEAYFIKEEFLEEKDPNLASSLVDVALIYSKQKKYEKSIECYKKALSIIEICNGKLSEDYIITLQHLILDLAITNSFDEVKPILSEYLGLLKKYTLQNFNKFSYESRNSFWINVNSSFERMFFVATCVQYRGDSDMAKNAYDIALLSKGIMLFSQINIEKTIRENRNDELITQLSLLQKLRLHNLEDPARKDSISCQIETLEREIVEKATRLDEFKWPLEYNWQDVQKSLKEGETAIEYFKTYSYYYAVLLRKEWEAPKVIELFKKEMIDSLLLKGQQLYHGDNSKYAYVLLFAKIRKLLKPGETIFFSPSGAIHQINLECLQDMDGKLLGETYNLVRLSSTRFLINKGNRMYPHSAALYGGLSYDVDTQEMLLQSKKYNRSDFDTLFDNSDTDSLYRSGWKELPETTMEINDIKSLFDKKKIPNTIYSGSLGNEESFKSLTGDSISIIHLATHGFFMKNKTINTISSLGNVENLESTSLMRSGLILSAAQKVWMGGSVPKNVDDGILFAEEISHINLSGTNLVVLSACQTGLGQINNDGVWGLQRAFKLAGVKSLIMSLWKVDDISTRLFMCEFYKYYLSGQSKMESLRSAQKYIREYEDEYGNKVFENPSYWASFILLDGID
jgi:CHAT domain-containing protein